MKNNNVNVLWYSERVDAIIVKKKKTDFVPTALPVNLEFSFTRIVIDYAIV